jgi:hypothetical protein
MAKRETTFKRLANLYKTVEAVRSAELRLAQMLVAETEQALAAQLSLAHRALAAGRLSLTVGDGLGWRYAEAHVAIASQNCERHKVVEAERNCARGAALERYLASRLESEQMAMLLGDSVEEARVVHDRLAQAESDDRYLSRKRWVEAYTSRAI